MTRRVRWASLALAAALTAALPGPALAEPSPAPAPTATSSPEPAPRTTEAVAVPAPPSITSSTATTDSIQVAWEWPGDGVAPEGVTAVIVRATPGDHELIVPATETTALIEALDPDTEYAITVLAAADNQIGEPSEPNLATTLGLVDTGNDIVDEATMKPKASPGKVDRLIVTLKSDIDTEAQVESVSSDLPVGGVAVEDTQDLGTGSAVIDLDDGVSDADAALIINDLESDPRVASVERDGRMYRTAFPDDPPDDPYWTSGSLWGLYGSYGIGIASSQSAMNAVWTSTASTQGNGAVVAVLDTGYTSHPDLDSNYVTGYDFVSSDLTSSCRPSATNADGDYVDPATYGPAGWDSIALDPGDWTTSASCDGPSDSSWHGTHVAGTIAGIGNNAAGVIGVAPQAQILPIRVLGVDGGSHSDITAAVNWAAGETVGSVPRNGNPADVINMSLGGSGSCPASLQSAITNAVNNGVVVVVSAGNSSADASNYTPANCAGVITVAASTSTGTLASYSNFGSTVEMTAPGSGIWSTFNSGTTVEGSPVYDSYSGTSMAAPHVSGAAALLLAGDPSLTPAQVLTRLQTDAKPFTGSGDAYPCSSSLCGAGLLRVPGAPTVMTASVTSGTTSGGTSLILTGVNLDGATTVEFGGTAATITANSATSITVTTPAHAEGTVSIAVTATAGTDTLASSFTYTVPVSSGGGGGGGGGGGSSSSSSSSAADAGGGGSLNEIKAITPQASGTPGSVIALAGWGLATTRAVSFNDISADFRVISDAHVEVTVPSVPPGVYVIHAQLAPAVGRASWWVGFHVLAQTGATPVSPPNPGASPGTTPGSPAGASSAGDLVGFPANSAVLTASTKKKLIRMATKVGAGEVTGTVLVFSDKRGTAESEKVARTRAKNVVVFLQSQGVTGEIRTVVEKGDTATLRRSAVVRLSTDPGASTVTTGERVNSLIVRYAKGVSPTVDGTVRGSSYVTGSLGSGMTLGPNLGLRMYRVDFARPVTLAEAKLAASQMAKDKGVQFAEPDRIVRANVTAN